MSAEHTLQEGLSLDVYSPSHATTSWPRGLAIEVDGPLHFLDNSAELVNGRPGPPRLHGRTLLKRRILHALGMRVISVPFYEWDELGRSPQRHTEYMAGRITEGPTGARHSPSLPFC